MKVNCEGKEIDVSVDDVIGVSVMGDHKGDTCTVIVVQETAKTIYGISSGVIYVEGTYIDTLFNLLIEQAIQNQNLKPDNRFWQAVKADVRASLEFIKNVAK